MTRTLMRHDKETEVKNIVFCAQGGGRPMPFKLIRLALEEPRLSPEGNAAKLSPGPSIDFLHFFHRPSSFSYHSYFNSIFQSFMFRAKPSTSRKSASHRTVCNRFSG